MGQASTVTIVAPPAATIALPTAVPFTLASPGAACPSACSQSARAGPPPRLPEGRAQHCALLCASNVARDLSRLVMANSSIACSLPGPREVCSAVRQMPEKDRCGTSPTAFGSSHTSPSTAASPNPTSVDERSALAIHWRPSALDVPPHAHRQHSGRCSYSSLIALPAVAFTRCTL